MKKLCLVNLADMFPTSTLSMPDVWFQAPLIGTSSAPFMRNGDSELFSQSPFLYVY